MLRLVASSPTPFLLPHGFHSLTVSTPSRVSTPSQSLPPPSSCFLVLSVSLSFCFLVVSTSSVSTSSQNFSPLVPLLCHAASLSILSPVVVTSLPLLSLYFPPMLLNGRIWVVSFTLLWADLPPPRLPRCLIDSWPAYGLAVLDQVPSMVLSPVGGLIRPGASSCLGLW